MIGFWKYDTRPYLYGVVEKVEIKNNKHIAHVPAYGSGFVFNLSHLFVNENTSATEEYDAIVSKREEAMKAVKKQFDADMEDWEEKYKSFKV